jgi:hypothetical protein
MPGARCTRSLACKSRKQAGTGIFFGMGLDRQLTQSPLICPSGKSADLSAVARRAKAKAHPPLDRRRTRIQQLLFREIARAEKTIRKLKSNLRAIQGTGARTPEKRSSYLKNRIEKVRQVAYVWRCFGDGIAFIYMDKFALKQCFYSTKNTNPRQDAGFMTDKRLERDSPSGVGARTKDSCVVGRSDQYHPARRRLLDGHVRSLLD